jgi:hypothetical protein
LYFCFYHHLGGFGFLKIVPVVVFHNGIKRRHPHRDIVFAAGAGRRGNFCWEEGLGEDGGEAVVFLLLWLLWLLLWVVGGLWL